MGSVFWKIAAAAAASASLAAHAIASSWTIVNLGTIGGPGLSSPQAISDNGIIAGCTQPPGTTGSRAFIWANGTMRDLAPEAPPGSSNCATAVNSSGMAGGSMDGEIALWKDGTTTRLGVKGGVSGINDAGIAVGTLTEPGSTQPPVTHGFMWTNGNLVVLPMDSAVAINARNEILGMASGSAVIFSNGNLTQLPLSNAKDFNDSDVVVGGMSFTPGEPSGFYYDGTAHIVPGSPCCGFAVGINDANQIIGSSEGVHGWYSEGGQTVNLGSLGGVAAAGWGHLEPTAINSRGWIVGSGNTTGAFDFGGFLLMPSSSSAPATSANPEARDMARSHALVRARYP